jgi:large subunit ribosomal protein L47
MARIKVIMNERRIAYEGAVKLIAEHNETVQDKQLLRLQRDALFKAQEKFDIFQTKGRNSARERKRQLLQVKADLAAEGALPETAAEVEAAPANTPTESEGTPEPVEAEAAATPSEAAPEPATAAPSTPPAKEAPAIPTGTSPQSAADTAAAGLFGGPVQKK